MVTLSEAYEPAAPTEAEEAHDRGGVRFIGTPRPFWQLLSRGAVLLMVTLGIYRFWLQTDIRRYLWDHTEIAGDTLEYLGTARELLLGFLIAIVLLVPVYTAFFIAALDLGLLGRISGLLAFVLLALLGHFAVYRARRYRLTRTVFRGLRFHQTGSAWRYAVCALLWWSLTIATLGLAYPFAQASLERYRMRHTFYGDLAGAFEASPFRLLVRGFVMWFAVVVPLVLGLLVIVGSVDWDVVADVLRRGGDDVMGRIEGASPGFAAALVFAIAAMGTSAIAAAVLLPAFQAMMLRWWASGLRFGELRATSRLTTASVYRVYARFLGYAILLALMVAAAAGAGYIVVALLNQVLDKSKLAEILTTAIFLVIYVATALGYSTVYQAVVKLRLWKVGFESIELEGLSVLDQVKAVSQTSSAVGEGLADALNVGGY